MVNAYRKGPVAPSLRACFLRLLASAGLCIASTAAAAPEGPVSLAVDASAARAAAASPWALPPSNLSRRSAVLGQPSRMEQILSTQGAPVVASPVPAVRPATAFTGFAAAGAGTMVSDVRREPAADTPNVFGSVALAVSRTPLDAQWQRAMGSQRARPLRAWTGAFAGSKGDEEALIAQVNQWVNARIRFTDDILSEGRSDRWASAVESLQRRRGDCEDYALAKMQLLDALGFERDRLFLVLVRDLVRRADHAVLVVQLEDRFVVLDNITDRVLESGAIRDYLPVMSYSWNGRWLHGYPATRPEPQPIQIAATISALTP